jgi:RNA polymerase primary sigma factor
MTMFGIILMSRSSPATRRRADLDRVILFPRPETTDPEDLEGPVAGSPPGRQTEGEPTPGLRIVAPKTRKSRKADIERARRLLATKLTYIAHPSFDDPSAHDAILAPSPGIEIPGLDRTPVSQGPDRDFSRGTRLPSREQEAHQFRKMNYLKCLACRIRDRIDPDSPDRGDLDQIERLQAEAVKLKNQIVETHLRLVVSLAKKRVRARYDMPERISDGTFALMHAVDRFNFALGNRFSTYATWAIHNEFTQHDRKERRRKNQSLVLYLDSLASPDSVSDEPEHEEAQNRRTAVVGRWLDRLDKRERRILASRYGIDGGPEQTMLQIGRDLGISKERVRQLVNRAQAKLRGFARVESFEPSTL